MPDPWQACREEIARHSRSFDLASRLFPPARRDEVAALYAWCRRSDDAIDLAPPGEQAAALPALRRELASVYAGEATSHPVLHCFQEVVERRAIPDAYPRGLLDGMEMDVVGARYDTVDDLLLYCWRVAGTVGLMMCHVMGVAEDRAARHAAHLGIAMQLTNVCRDVVEDWGLGRIYLPAELLGADLRRFLAEHEGASDPPSLPASAAPDLARAVTELLRLAERYYDSADVGLRMLEPRSALAIRAARLLYAEIGRGIEARRGDVLAGRVVVPTRRKLRLLGRALRRLPADRRAWKSRPLVAPKDVLEPADAIRLAPRG